MDRRISPGPLAGGVLGAPSSKSEAHRAFVLASLCDEPTRVSFSGLSDDLRATLRCLAAMGAEVALDGEGAVISAGHWVKSPRLPCGESGSTLRFLMPLCAALGQNASFLCEGRLAKRPNGPLLRALENRGVSVADGPLALSGLFPGRFPLPGDVSSQYVSGLLMALPLLPGESEIALEGPLQSKGYVDLTLSCLRTFGLAVHTTEEGYRIPGHQRPHSPKTYAVEGDWSNAAFWLVAGALGNGIKVKNITLNSKQGDRAVFDILRAIGARIAEEEGAIACSSGECKPFSVDVRQIPDLAPILAVAACGVKGESELTGIARLRLKESDRVEAIRSLICGLGGQCEIRDDRLLIAGAGFLRGGEVPSFADHRIVMAAAIAATLCREEVIVRGAQAVQKSYPGFFEDFEKMGGKSHVL